MNRKLAMNTTIKTMKKTLEDYRKGAAGALMDEYERTAVELKSVLQTISEAEYVRIADAETENENCRSIQTIASHVVRAGYSYSNYLREQFSMAVAPVEIGQISRGEIGTEIDKMLAYTIETLDGRWEMTEEEIMNAVIKARWGVTYDIEQLLEHAIVHVLRHRRQIEKFLIQNSHHSAV